MRTQRDNEKLDELICRTINTEKPQFDAEKWKQKYPDEYQTLISRKNKSASYKLNIWKVVFGKRAAQIAAAAVIVVVGLLLSQDRQNPNGPASKPALIPQSPSKIVSMASMRMTYQKGGMDALDQQFRDALDILGPRSSSVSILELREGLNMF
jgi:hypothetical protein